MNAKNKDLKNAWREEQKAIKNELHENEMNEFAASAMITSYAIMIMADGKIDDCELELFLDIIQEDKLLKTLNSDDIRKEMLEKIKLSLPEHLFMLKILNESNLISDDIKVRILNNLILFTVLNGEDMKYEIFAMQEIITNLNISSEAMLALLVHKEKQKQK